jgi:alpha-aminoadipic semialdehyde synthase
MNLKFRRWITIGIRKEDKGIWECRTPLTPQALKELQPAHKFIVQPCSRRIFANSQYRNAGATLSEDLSDCDLILGIKEVPEDKLLNDKAYMFFSHTHKGQRHNMKLLKNILEKNVTLIDYEMMTDEKGKRMVAFGRYAGIAGAINGLYGLGEQLLSKGFRTPLVTIGLAHNYKDVEQAKQFLQSLEFDLELDKPLVITVTGDGNVSQGALEILKCLPHVFITIDDLRGGKLKPLPNQIYLFHALGKDYLQHRAGGVFDFGQYLAHPEEFTSTFERDISPQTCLLINGIYWESKYPRLITKEALAKGAGSLLSIADISCDIDGSIEITKKASTIEEPFFYYKTERGDQIQVMSIDNLPTQLPVDSSQHFSACLVPILKVVTDRGSLLKNDTISRATITKDKEIAGSLSGLLGPLVKKIKSFVIFGSGYVTGPTIEYLSRHGTVTVVTDKPHEAEISARENKIKIVNLKLHEKIAHSVMDPIISSADVVISLLPAAMHPWIAKSCLKNGKHLVTASYVSPEMQEFHEKASEKSLVFLNEIGLDPGIDHLGAMEIIEGERAKGNAIESFVSWCGGLPAPEAANNPFGYRFSWSPMGVLLAAQNDAQFKENGESVYLKDSELLTSYRFLHNLFPALNLQGIPNRNSISYTSKYNLDEAALKTILRGTLRYAGFFDLLEGFRQLGYLIKVRYLPECTNWLQASQMIFAEEHDFIPTIRQYCDSLDTNQQDELFETMQWLGLFSEKEPFDPSEPVLVNLSRILQKKMYYEPGQRDAVYLHHSVISRSGAEESGQREVIKASMQVFGDDRWTAMARTVGYPVGIAARLVAEGAISERGVIIPVKKEIYDPMLAELGEYGIKFDISRKRL